MKEFDENLNRLPKDTLIVVDLHRTWGNLRLYELIHRYFDYRILINFFPNTQRAYNNKYWAKIKESSIGDILAYFKITRMFNCFTLSSALGTEYRINHPDYEEFIRHQNLESEERSPYIVYVDNYFPLHPEVLQRNPLFKANDMAGVFYESLNNYFERIEKEFGCRVIIAAHPSADYSKNPFGGRKIVYNKTCELIKDSQKVCMHTSNSLSYVIMYDKPVALLSNYVYRQAKIDYKRLLQISNLIKVPITEMDLEQDRYLFRHIDKGFNENYKKKYLIGAASIANSELFKKHLEKIYSVVHGC
ncbi:MAG: hypothetical protein J1E58_01510 [Prevotella sp.]|nr:hypothetical protein [Prevotella sp.]